MRYFLFFLTILAFGFSQAQPQKVNYQAVALTAGGQTVKNQAIKLRLSILDSSATGTVLYTETHQPTTDGAGQFSVFLGGGTATLGTFSNIAWSNGKDKFLKAEADVTGGTNYVLMGTSQIVSVPYALAAGSLKEGATITGANGSQYTLTIGANGPMWSLTNLNVNFSCGQAVTYAGESYPTVQIGSQCWFKKNLNVGTMVQGPIDQSQNNIIEKYCYDNDSNNCAIFGGLYQWGEAIQYSNGASNITSPNPSFSSFVSGICPIGWHIPNDNEWCLLFSFLDNSVNCNSTGLIGTDIGGKLQSPAFWATNLTANNSSGFSAIPAGLRVSYGWAGVSNGGFTNLTYTSPFWSISANTNTTASTFITIFNTPKIEKIFQGKFHGLSIRCLKD